MKHQCIIEMAVEQQSLRFISSGFQRKPIMIGFFFQDNRHAVVNVSDMVDCQRGENGAARNANIVIVGAQA